MSFGLLPALSKYVLSTLSSEQQSPGFILWSFYLPLVLAGAALDRRAQPWGAQGCNSASRQ